MSSPKNHRQKSKNNFTNSTSNPSQTLVKHHPRQRLPAPSRGLSASIHALGLASYAYSFNYLINNPNPINSSYGWHFQYLTIIGLSLATLTFVAGFLADLTPSAATVLFRTKNLLSICAAPLEVLISLLYWGLRLIDPELVVPKELELPFFTDLSFHAFPSLLLLVDLLFLSPPWTIGVAPALALSGVIAFAYWFWIELCFSYNGFYPYPIFGLLDRAQRVALFGGSALVMTAATVALKAVHGWVNGAATPREAVGMDGEMGSGSGKVKAKGKRS